jgi:hypothetical protein
MRSALRTSLVLGIALVVGTAAVATTHVGDWDVTGEVTGSGNFHTFGDSSYVTPFSGWSGNSRMVAVRQPNAVSTGVCSGFMFSNNQTSGNFKSIAQLMFLNEAIGVADKRVAQILVTTGGSTDSGKMYIRMYDGGAGTNGLVIRKDGTIEAVKFPDGETQTTAFMGASGGGFDNTATGANATVGGGQGNDAGGGYSTVGGGATNIAGGELATVGGGFGNFAIGSSSTAGGGMSNAASAGYATVGGGYSNLVTDDYSTIGGGYDNQAGDAAGASTDAAYATVGGGYENTASDWCATVGGGHDNIASGSYATVGGGSMNTASGNHPTVAGGHFHEATGDFSTIGGGYGNDATGAEATVGGGRWNRATGNYSAIPGGLSNTASGDYSFAAGRRAKADDDGSFVLADSTNSDVPSMASNRITARFTGGYLFYTDTALTTWSYLAAGSGTWSDSSDRARKENVRSVDTREVLDKLARIPIATWNYKTQDQSIRHMGPMAQDLHAAFGLGESDTHITTIDADGVALAAIQGLYEAGLEKDAQIAALRAEKDAQVAALQKEVEALKAVVENLIEK